jgi:hypothetical protein
MLWDITGRWPDFCQLKPMLKTCWGQCRANLEGMLGQFSLYPPNALDITGPGPDFSQFNSTLGAGWARFRYRSLVRIRRKWGCSKFRLQQLILPPPRLDYASGFHCQRVVYIGTPILGLKYNEIYRKKLRMICTFFLYKGVLLEALLRFNPKIGIRI